MSWKWVLIISCPLFLQAQVYPFPDNSIPTAYYQEMSFPPLDKPWGLKEYEKAMNTLESIYSTDKYSLPRYNSPYSKTIFAKLTNPNHLRVLNDKSIPLEQRLEVLNQLPSQISRLLVLYMEGTEEYRFGAEMLQCFAFYTHFTSNALDLVEELQAQLGERGQTLRFIKGKQSMERKHFDICVQILNHLIHDEAKFPKGVLSDFARTMEFDFLIFYKKNPNSKQVTLRDKIQKAIPTLKNKGLKKVFEKWGKH